jgi:hypothetical protein
VGVISRFLAVLFLAGTSVLAQKQIESSVKTFNAAEGAREAEKLLAQVFAERPEQTFTNALLRIRERDREERKVIVRLQTSIGSQNWSATYAADPAAVSTGVTKAVITHNGHNGNDYKITDATGTTKTISPAETNIPFANSDFSIADLGLEFLHWPEQRITKKEMYSSRFCAILESTDPHPVKGGYARVRSWITLEPPLAPIRAEAYDANGKRVKVFEVKGVERVKGRFQVDSVEMRNIQNGSRTVMEFDFEA